MQKNKNHQKSTELTSHTFTISQVFFTLYLCIGFIPNMGAVDYDAPEWLYLSLLNVVVLLFIARNATVFNAFTFHKNVKIFLWLFCAFFIIGCLSIFNAVSVDESLVHLSRLANVIVALYCLFLIVRQHPMFFFNFLCKAAVIITAYFSWKAIQYFIGNYSSQRTHGFLKLFPHNYGSINIYAAYLAVQFPFVIYGFIYFKKIWKYVSGVVVFMIVLALFFASARTALLSSSIILFIFIGYLIYGTVKHKLPFKREIAVLIIFPIILGFFVLNINRLDKSSMNSINELLVSREADFFKGRNAVRSGLDDLQILIPKDIKVEIKELSGSGRFSLWNLAYIRFKEHPFLGIGYGNYKAIGKKEHYLIYSHREGLFANPRRTHNDFLEKMAETGIFGLVLYVLLFIVPFILFINVFKREKQFEKQFVLVVILASAIAYTLDALLNFPLERPPVQLYFLLIVIFILLFSQKEPSTLKKPSHSKLHFLFFAGVFLISFATIVSNYLVFKSYKLELSIRNDFQGTSMFEKKANPKYNYESLKKQWINYPDLTYAGTIKKVYLANYAIKDKKYEEALDILKNSLGTNTDGFVAKQTIANIYLKMDEDLDSVKKYASEVFESYPGFKTNFHTLRAAYLKENDTLSVFRVMDRYSKYNPRDAEEWKIKANIVYDLTKDSKRMLAVIDTALVYNRYSNTLLLAKKEVLGKLNFKSYLSKDEVKAKHQAAFEYFGKQKYKEARAVFEEILKTNPKDYLSIQNIGIIDLVQKNYEQAIQNLNKVIAAKAFSDGKAEYSRGYCYEQLGKLEKAKADYKASRAKKYPQAMSLPESKYQ